MRKSIKNTLTNEVVEVVNTISNETEIVEVHTILWDTLEEYESSFIEGGRIEWYKKINTYEVSKSSYDPKIDINACKSKFNLHKTTTNCLNCVCETTLTSLKNILGENWVNVD